MVEVSATLRCPYHPNYKAIHAPRPLKNSGTVCVQCSLMFDIVQMIRRATTYKLRYTKGLSNGERD